MPTVQTSQLQTDILELLDASGAGRYPATLLNRRINLAQEKLLAIIARTGGDDDLLTYTVGVVLDGSQGIRTIPLPAFAHSTSVPSWWLRPSYTADEQGPLTLDLVPTEAAPGLYRLRSLSIVEAPSYSPVEDAVFPLDSWSGRTRVLERCSLEDLHRDTQARDWTYANPPRYRMLGTNTIVLDRASNAAAGFLISYTADVSALGTTDYAAFPPLWGEFIITDVVAALHERNRNVDLSAYYRQQNQALADQILTTAQNRDEHGPPRIRETDGVAGMGDQEYRDFITYNRGGW